MDEKNIENFSDLKEAFTEKKNETKEHILQDVKELREIVKQIPRLSTEIVKRGFKKILDNINSEHEKVDSEKLLSTILAHTAAGKTQQENDKWGKTHANRSKTARKVIANLEKKSMERKVKVAEFKIKVTGAIAKGVALFGAKGLSKEMFDKVNTKNMKNLSKESRIGKMMKKVFESGFKVADSFRNAKTRVVDGVKSTYNLAKQTNKAIFTATKNTAKKTAKYIQDFGRNTKNRTINGVKNVGNGISKGYKRTKQAVKKGTLAVGKASLDTVATVAAIGSIGLDAAKLGVKNVANRTKDGFNFVKDYVKDRSEDIKDYYKLGKDKVGLAKSNIGIGIKKFLKEKVSSLLGKIDASLQKSDAKATEHQQAIVANRKNPTQRGQQEQQEQTR